ncbi:hypothetical protein ACF061_08260 [Streptomyces sp. NPDC015220]|uniref:hypothetical protein n=1 Tax=Streptomyces sp. NPDC015220 TaxID=3364947 RepID=UPI0036FCCA43
MEQLRQDDPPWTGPYAALARVDSVLEQARTPDRRFIARSADGRRTVMLCLPRADVDPTRWAVEAEGAVNVLNMLVGSGADLSSTKARTTWSFRVIKAKETYWMTGDGNRVFLMHGDTLTALPVF